MCSEYDYESVRGKNSVLRGGKKDIKHERKTCHEVEP